MQRPRDWRGPLTITLNQPRPGYRGIFRRNPDFRRLFTGQVVSYAGDWFLTVALVDLVLEKTGSGLLVSLLILCQTLPSFLVSPYAGTVVDRVDRRRLMVLVNGLSGCMALLPLLARSSETLPFAFIGVIGLSCGVGFFGPASQASLPNVVRPDDLARANVLMGSTWGTMLAVGAALGGLATATLGRDAAIVIDSASFFFAAVMLGRIRTPFQQARQSEHPRFLPAMREAARYARRNRPVLALLAVKGGFSLSSGVVVLLSVFGHEVFHAGAAGIGVLFCARGVGALLGPFVLQRFGRGENGPLRFIGVCGVLYGIGYSFFAVAPFLALAAPAVVLAHLGGGAQWTMSSYGLQRLVPDDLRGRIFAADYGLATLTLSISSLMAGVLVDAIGPSPAVLVIATPALLWGIVWSVWTWSLWGLPSPEPPAQPVR